MDGPLRRYGIACVEGLVVADFSVVSLVSQGQLFVDAVVGKNNVGWLKTSLLYHEGTSCRRGVLTKGPRLHNRQHSGCRISAF